MAHTNELKHVSLCAGYGGLDLGLARALRAVRTVAFVEIEAFAVLNLVKKIEAGHLDECPIFTDLKAFPWELYRGRVDILSGGFPCQPFSSAGRRAGDSDPRHLWPYIADGIRRLGHPALVFLENVEGIISSKLTGSEWADPEGTPVLLHVLRELERLGYEATAGVFSASEVGAPHQRKRVFILGYRSDLSETGREIVDGLLKGSERGQDVGHSSCRSGKWFQLGKGNQEQDRESSTSRAWPASRGAEQYPWEPARVTMGDTNSRNKESRFSDSSLSSETIEKGQTSEPGGSNLDRYESQSELDNTNREGFLRGLYERPYKEQVGRENANKYNAQAGSPTRGIQGQAEPALGRDIDGPAGGLGYAELCESFDNRTDELRMLGNGVVPATAERAFRVLWKDLRAR